MSTNKKNSKSNESKKTSPSGLGFRDKDGRIKLYEEGKAPTYWERNSKRTNAKTGEQTFTRKGNRFTDDDDDHGETYTVPESSGYTQKYFEEEWLEIPKSPTAGIPLPQKRRRDLLPDSMVLKNIDEYSMKAPLLMKENLSTLVEYLTSTASTDLEKVRAFYIWITHNINYDTSGYFGRAKPKPTDPASVLRTRLTVCEGYCRLFEAFCVEAKIPVKIVSGFAKAYGYKPGSDVTQDVHNAHAWNAVLIDSDWFLCDVTWGAGYVKAKEKTYVASFNEAYFLTDPEIFVTDHFPSYIQGFDQYESDPRWQLIEECLSLEQFCNIVNFDKHGKEWGIEPASHEEAVIKGIEYEIDIILKEAHEAVSDFVAFLYEDDRKLEQFTYTFKPSANAVAVHVFMPKLGLFGLQIYGRRQKDGKHSNYQPIVKYVLHCAKAHQTAIPYPSHHTVYGPVHDLKRYGISDIGDVYNEAKEGEIILQLKALPDVDIVPKLRYGDHNRDLRNYCFIDYSECFKYINVVLRLRYEGYYKLELLAIPEKDKHYSTFMTYLIRCKRACRDGIFLVSNIHAMKYMCCIIEPLSRIQMPNTDVYVCIKSPILKSVRCPGGHIVKIDDVTFEGTIRTPNEGETFIIEGSGNDGYYHSLYTYKASCIVGDIDTE
ncbi:hypothetical protein ACF0H5_020260 [Mactra antiquata]